MDCQLAVCTVAGVMFDFNEWSGYALLGCIVGVVVNGTILLVTGGKFPNLRKSAIVQRIADRFESDGD